MTIIFPSMNPASKMHFSKQRGNNALATTANAMPMKFDPSDNTSHYSSNRTTFRKDVVKDTTYTDNSSYIQRKKANAIGKQSTYNGNFAFKSNVKNDRRKALRRVRAGGAVVRMKKRNKHL